MLYCHLFLPCGYSLIHKDIPTAIPWTQSHSPHDRHPYSEQTIRETYSKQSTQQAR